MKWIFYWLLFCTPWILSAQEWQNICSPGVTLYQNSGGEIQAFRLDSIQLPGNGDTIFFSYHTIREQQTCSDTTQGSVLGFRIFKTPSGWFYFFNRYEDTLRLNTMANLMGTWQFCELPDSGFIEATVSDIKSGSILGIPDSLKVITFQAYDLSGNPVTHILNGRQVSLSKLHGLTEMADVYLLPDTFSLYHLAGITLPEAGIPDLDEKLIYDFNVGDEFHYMGADTYQSGHVTWTYWRKILTVLSREESITGDAFVYKAMRCIHQDVVPYPTWGSPYVENIRDTITLHYPYPDPLHDTSRIRLPGMFFRQSYGTADHYSRDFSGPGGRQRQANRGHYYRFQDSCWILESMSRSWFEYTVGIGCSYFGSGVEFVPGEISMFYEDRLVYYKKGEEEWGTRLAANCDQLLGSSDSNVSGFRFQVFLYPNPLHDQMTLTIGEFKPGIRADFILYDFLGREVYQTVIRQNEVTLNRPSIPNGLYIWKVTRDLGIVTGKLVLE